MQSVNAMAMPLPGAAGIQAMPYAMPQGAFAMPQGMQMQAMNPQAMQLQGMNPQGMQMQGMAPQGMLPQGVVPQGMTLGAMNPNAAAMGPVTVMPQAAMPAGMNPGMPLTTPAAQGMLGAEATKPPSTIGSMLKSALVFGGLGAAAGAVASWPLPVGMIPAALIGGAAGALLGAFRGLRAAKRAQEEYKMMMQGSPGAPGNPGALGPQVPVHVGDTTAPAAPKKKRTAARRAGITVRSGDTLGAIARKHKVTVKQLHEANREVIGANPAHIKPGMKLVIPHGRG